MNLKSIIPLLAMSSALGSSERHYVVTPPKRSASSLSRRQISRMQLRAERKKAHIARCRQQALAEKCRLMRNGKGRNGMSMSGSLLAAHNYDR